MSVEVISVLQNIAWFSALIGLVLLEITIDFPND